MDNKITVNGLKFVPYLTEDEIMVQVRRVAGEIRRDLEGKSPVFLCALNGAFVFAADLYRGSRDDRFADCVCALCVI